MNEAFTKRIRRSGGPPELGPVDGTVVPSATEGSLPFLPQATLRVLKNMKNRFAPNVWSCYGFCECAQSANKKWCDSDVIAIDTPLLICGLDAQPLFGLSNFGCQP